MPKKSEAERARAAESLAYFVLIRRLFDEFARVQPDGWIVDQFLFAQENLTDPTAKEASKQSDPPPTAAAALIVPICVTSENAGPSAATIGKCSRPMEDDEMSEQSQAARRRAGESLAYFVLIRRLFTEFARVQPVGWIEDQFLLAHENLTDLTAKETGEQIDPAILDAASDIIKKTLSEIIVVREPL